jgi:hypothetical protein
LELTVNAVEAQVAIGFGEAQRVRDRHGLALFDPLVHAPEMGIVLREVQIQCVDQPRNQGQLLGRSDRAANAGRIVRRALPPGFDVLQRLGEIELFERIVVVDGKRAPAP